MTNRRANFVNMVKYLQDVPDHVIKNEMKITNQSPWRQGFHIESKSGTLGDPNGFSYFNGQYHLFHQWSPVAFSQNPHFTQHGWRHLVSENLVDWQDLGAGMESDTKLDQYGTYSGSALALNDKQLFIMYTGNTWTNTESEDDWHRVPYQVGAIMDQNNHIEKWTKPLLIGPLPGYTGHFRDPKVFKKDDYYYAVLGIQRKNETGAGLLVKSGDLHNWEIIGEIKPHQANLGYMWECPDYFEINGQGILEFCPQGLKSEGNRYQNIYQNGYLLGNPMNLANGEFQCYPFQELDLGFDFYAMQTMEDSQGRRILSAWMGLPEIKYPTEKYHYAGCLIFPRELHVQDGQIIQKPVDEITKLYEQKHKIDLSLENTSHEIKAGQKNQRDISLTIDCRNCNVLTLDLFADQNNQEHLRLIFNHKKQEFIVDRGNCGVHFGESYGSSRTCHLNLDQKIKVRILQDESSAEIFLDNGKKVFSMRVFPNKKANQIFATSENGEAKVAGTIYQLREAEL